MQLLDQLNPQIKVSDKEFPELLLGNFHMVVISEPDPETWMANLDEDNEFYSLLEFHSDLIVDELYGEMEMPEEGWEAADDVEETVLIAVGEGMEIPLYYHQAVNYAHAVFRNESFEYDRFRYFLRGVAEEHPNWRVAVIGGVYEDEVVRVANAVFEEGFDTTILTRFCISSHSLVDLDALFASIPEEEHRRLSAELMADLAKEDDEEKEDNEDVEK